MVQIFDKFNHFHIAAIFARNITSLMTNVKRAKNFLTGLERCLTNTYLSIPEENFICQSIVYGITLPDELAETDAEDDNEDESSKT
ncbi:unnamed protein product [Acanthoscelides obtectus]|uniref:Uncharacterized protein n=1 Tax=Acanthoscelides obtectus TaxID=200917 RepID=A0A9P0M338_ACAOB|nr:unnamed protein product [Acanthoscelides obtectus]CAK1625110.1 hypothetical protein AOBTE_LOCUS2960 [Acanthoscelides obtectus]